MSRGAQIPAEALLDLRRRMEQLRPRDPGRKVMVANAAQLYGVSRYTIYRALKRQLKPERIYRSDKGKPRKLSREDLERYCEIIAAVKLRTANKKGHKMSTQRIIDLLEQHGIETPGGFVKVEPGILSKSTVNRFLKLWGYNHERLTRAPAAVRFEAQTSNEMWQFDISPSDLKEIEQPAWIDPIRKSKPVLMLFSVVDDRSGAAYLEYRCTYGEDTENGLRFLFAAMAPKAGDGVHLQGIPKTLYLDNGPIAKSGVFRRVMERLGVTVQTHRPAEPR